MVWGGGGCCWYCIYYEGEEYLVSVPGSSSRRLPLRTGRATYGRRAIALLRRVSLGRRSVAVRLRILISIRRLDVLGDRIGHDVDLTFEEDTEAAVDSSLPWWLLCFCSVSLFYFTLSAGNSCWWSLASECCWWEVVKERRWCCWFCCCCCFPLVAKKLANSSDMFWRVHKGKEWMNEKEEIKRERDWSSSSSSSEIEVRCLCPGGVLPSVSSLAVLQETMMRLSPLGIIQLFFFPLLLLQYLSISISTAYSLLWSSPVLRHFLTPDYDVHGTRSSQRIARKSWSTRDFPPFFTKGVTHVISASALPSQRTGKSDPSRQYDWLKALVSGKSHGPDRA